MPTDTPLPPTSPQKDNMPSDLPPGPTQGDDMPRDLPLPIPRSPGLQALIERAKADLAKRLSIQASQIEVIGTQEAAWQDASLGCRQPGATYAQIPTPGYIITLKYGDTEYEYHGGIHGNVVYCENPTHPILGTPPNLYPFDSPTP